MAWPGRVGRLAGAGALLAVLVWPAQLAAVALADTVRWPVELWAGVLTLVALEAVLLGAG